MRRCGTLTNHVRNEKGYLTTSCIRPAQPENITLDSILFADKHYYHLGEGARAVDYPNCAAIETWGYPLDNLSEG